ncbi:FUSC family protein [Geodermatophilus sp. SYSU D00079]
MTGFRAFLRHPQAQRGIRAAIAAGLAWQVAVLLPAPFPEYAYYAPMGAIIAVHPTVADSASATWRTVLAILLGSGLAVAVDRLAGGLPEAAVLALLVALAVVLEQWRVLGENAGWVSFAAVFVLTIGIGDTADFVLSYAGLVLLGAGIGVLATLLLFPPLQLTRATREIARTRTLVAEHVGRTAAELRAGRFPTPEDERARGAALRTALDAMRDAERTVERARRANPRAARWQDAAARVHDESRALDRVAVLLDDVTAVVAEYPSHRRDTDRPDADTARRLALALDGLAGVVRTPYHAADGTRPDDRDRAVAAATAALDGLVDRLRRTTLDDDPAFLAVAAVAVGVERSLLALDAVEAPAA